MLYCRVFDAGETFTLPLGTVDSGYGWLYRSWDMACSVLYGSMDLWTLLVSRQEILYNLFLPWIVFYKPVSGRVDSWED